MQFMGLEMKTYLYVDDEGLLLKRKLFSLNLHMKTDTLHL